ncbi:efflux RND transporter permease subunit [Faecalibacter rhinopitheci]|uniref:Efflux RND transporter permease subunit n=1 Tax=Faecalibacter rhinopitheci TaxID=2779678 RepID=A0A8J7FSU2_9FLAO|nr:efflux RND transporter permease subunit [Faecalibacter rhinopitheci]MBF0598260.1 efflux RND transporter permease subunit [Faecalibacter rhinopitheci]
MKLAEISIKRPTLIVVLFTILTLGGILSYKSLGYELIPKFEVNVVTVSTVYPGASPSEVENSVTKKIEDAVSSLENVKKVESKSYESLSVVMITLNSDADADYSLNDAQRKINQIVSDLPDDVDAPSLSKFSMSDLPIITAGVSSDKLNDKELYDLLDKKIEPILSRVKGVAQVNLIGGQEREIQVRLDAKKLEGYGLSVPQVQQAVLSSNLDFPTGKIKTRENSTIIRLSGKYKTVDELKALVLTSNNGIQIRLSDVAYVYDSQKEVDKVARLNQEPSILFQVVKQSDANAVEVSALIQKTVEQIEAQFAQEGLKVRIMNDTSTFTLNAANSVVFDLVLAIILVAIVMLLFLHSIRNAFIVMIAIPASLIATFIGIELLGYTLNLMTLLGLSLVVGILVDDAIVVLENIYRHMEMGKSRIRASYDGAAEIGFTVTAITLVIVVVFLPIALSTGLVAGIIGQFCVTVVIATLLSLLSSFTIVPWLSSRFGKLEHLTGKNLFEKFILGFEKLLNNFTHWIADLLKWCLSSVSTKIASIVGASLLLVASFMLVPLGYIGTAFFPKIDKGEFLVQIELPKDASVEQTNQKTIEIERFLRDKTEIVDLITTVGQQSGGMGASQATAYQSEIDVILVDKAKREDNSSIFAAKIKKELQQKFVGIKIKTVPVGLIGAENAPLKLTITGTDYESAAKFADQALAILKEIPGSSEPKLSSEAGNPEITVSVDRDKMSALGLNLQTVGVTMQTAFSGNTDGKFRAGEYEYDINIQYDNFNRQSIEDVKNIIVVNSAGLPIKLSQFAEVVQGSGPSLLERRDKTAAVSVESQVVGVPVGTVANEWMEKLDNLDRPAGVEYVWGGDMENQTEGFGTLGIALLAAIILVYLVMVALYDSFVYPFVVLFSIPLSLIGVFIILALTNNSLNVFTILGMIMLIGLVCKNAILLVDFTNQRKEAGESTYNALLQANHARLRPILMTTIAMVIGMIPIAMAKGAGAEMNNGLAWVIIGGLISSLFLTLIIVPVVYSIFDSLIKRFTSSETIDYEAEMKADYEERQIKEEWE